MAHLLSLAAGIQACNLWLARVVSWLLLAMVLGQFSSVIARYVFATGSIRLQESILYMHAILFLLTAAGALAKDVHVRLDVFYRPASPPRQMLVNLVGSVLFTVPFCVLIFSSSLDYIRLSWSVEEGSREISGLPFVYLLKSVILLFALSLGLQGFANAVMVLAQIRRAPATLKDRE